MGNFNEAIKHMDPVEPIVVLNARLVEYFGIAWNGWPSYRVVWSEDQMEKRYGTYDDYVPGSKIFIRRVTEMRDVPKYRQWIQNKFILEQLTAVPEINRAEICEKISYEPLWVFEDREGNPLPPKWEAIAFIIDHVMAAKEGNTHPKYVDPMAEDPIGTYEASIKKIEEELWGNETDIGDALAHKQGIVVPRHFKENN